MAIVGIVTFHRAHNYGAVLQCLALKTALTMMGHTVHVIDHINPRIEEIYSLTSKVSNNVPTMNRIKQWITLKLTYPYRRKRFEKFNMFICKYILDNEYHNKYSDYDCIIWGSDQIWQWNITREDPFFWAQIDNADVRKISYAASAGKINDKFKNNMHFLSSFDRIGVREEELHVFLKKNGINSEVNIDPTLLLSSNEWEKTLKLKNQSNKRYVLIYGLRNRKKVYKLGKAIAKMKGLDVNEVFSTANSLGNLGKKNLDISPDEFIQLIRNAEFIVTDSFHCTVFSIIFNKQFITAKLNDGNDNRSAGLLNSLGIIDRLTLDTIISNSIINFSNVNRKIDELRATSISYLHNNVK